MVLYYARFMYTTVFYEIHLPNCFAYILQKSRARLTDSNRGSNKRQTAATAAANRKANLVAQLSVTEAAKAQASLASNNTTNFHHVTQSQRQSTALQLQLPLQSQSQSQASPKRATNVCIVRPQQQQLEKIATSSPASRRQHHHRFTPTLHRCGRRRCS